MYNNCDIHGHIMEVNLQLFMINASAAFQIVAIPEL